MTDMKTPFLAILDASWTYILPPIKRPKYKEFSKQHYNIQSIRKTEDQSSIVTNFVT